MSAVPTATGAPGQSKTAVLWMLARSALLKPESLLSSAAICSGARI
jgi:hypothetical protein